MSFYSVHFALVVTLLDALALVILVLTARKTYHQFRKPPFVYKKACGDDCESGILDRLPELAQLLAFKQQFPVATCSVVIVGTIEIFRHIHVFHPQLIADEYTIGIYKTGLAQTDGLDFSTCEHNTRRICVGYDIVKRGTFVLYIYRNFSFIHITNSIRQRGNPRVCL